MVTMLPGEPSDRYRTIEGSAFDVEYGSGYDLVLLTNFLHHFDMATCEALLRKVRAALAEGGRAVTLECRTRIASRRRRLRGLV